LFGVKPLQDIERIVFVMGQDRRERGPGGERDERMYFLIQGKFDEKKFEQAYTSLAKEHPNTVKVHGTGRSAILAMKNENSYISLVDRSTMIFGPSKKLCETLQERASGKTKPKFKLNKDIPAALKALNSSVAIDAVGFGPLVVGGSYERGPNKEFIFKAKTLDDYGFRKLTVQIGIKDELSGKVMMEGKTRDGFAAMAKQITEGLEKEKTQMQRFAQRDPMSKVILSVLKATTAKSTDQSITFEAKVGHDDAKAFLDGIKQEFDRMQSGSGSGQKKSE
jgi:hypothetical protein